MKFSDEPVRHINKMILLTTVHKIINMDLIAFTYEDENVDQEDLYKLNIINDNAL